MTFPRPPPLPRSACSNCVPFGLKNAAQAIQRLMDQVGQGLPFVLIYLDVILVASALQAEHVTHLRLLFQRLRENGLVIKPTKCQLGLVSISFLGYWVTPQGAVSLPTKVKAMQPFPQPLTFKGLQEFVGMVNFYQRFVPAAAAVMRPLFQCLPGKLRDLVWSAEANEGSRVPRQRWLMPPCWCTRGCPPPQRSPLTHRMLLLVQFVDNRWQPLAFFSRQLQSANTALLTEILCSTWPSDTSGISSRAVLYSGILVRGRWLTVILLASRPSKRHLEKVAMAHFWPILPSKPALSTYLSKRLRFQPFAHQWPINVCRKGLRMLL